MHMFMKLMSFKIHKSNTDYHIILANNLSTEPRGVYKITFAVEKGAKMLSFKQHAVITLLIMFLPLFYR